MEIKYAHETVTQSYGTKRCLDVSQIIRLERNGCDLIMKLLDCRLWSLDFRQWEESAELLTGSNMIKKKVDKNYLMVIVYDSYKLEEEKNRQMRKNGDQYDSSCIWNEDRNGYKRHNEENGGLC